MINKLRRFIVHVILLIIMLSLVGCGQENNQVLNTNEAITKTNGATQEDSISQEYTSTEESVTELNEVIGGFQVDGTKLLDANGNEFVMRGINHSHTWFRENDGLALAGISKTGANCIRLVFSNAS